MSRLTAPWTAAAAVLALFGCWAVLCPPRVHAATDEIIAAAACARIDWREQAGAERARTYRQAVDCFKALYLRVARGPDAHVAFDTELANRLDTLETAFHASRDICRLRENLGINNGSCGTNSLSPHEFVVLLKTMILNEDAGWVRRDPKLVRALRLDE